MDGMTEFRLTYDGPALISHEMHPRDLAPALLAMADLLEASARVMYGEKAKVDVQIKGTFKTGSFNIDFVTGVQWLKSIRDFFTGPEAVATANATAILTAVGIIGRGLFSLMKWLRGRPVSHVEKIGPDAQGFRQVRVHADGESYDVRRDTLNLMQDVSVRAALERVIKPLDRPGVEIFAIGNGAMLNVTISGAERICFAAPRDGDHLLTDDVRDIPFLVTSSINEDPKAWQFSDGTSTVTAAMSDEPLLKAIEEKRMTLMQQDLLVCRTRVRQWQTDKGIRTEYDVVQVMRHIRGNRQIPMPLDVFGLSSAIA